MRATFIIDRKKIIRHLVINDEPLGRDMDELIRTIQSLQFFEENGRVCPAGWKDGDSGMVNTPDGVSEFLQEKSSSL